MTVGQRATKIPRVSIGMPVRNGERFVRQGIESILSQSFGDFELIISDNSSTDQTPAICEAYALNEPRIRFTRIGRNIGHQANFNRVLDLAAAPYFMWACHDDLWDASYVKRMVEVLDERDRVVLAGSNAGSVDQDGVVRRWYDNKSVFAGRSPATRARRFISAPPGGGHSTLIYALFRTPVIRRHGMVQLGRIRRQDLGYYFACDKLTLFSMIFEGEFHVDDEALYLHRDVVDDSAPRPHVRALARTTPRLMGLLAANGLDVHDYYRDLRTLVRRAPISPVQRDALTRHALREELRFYPRILMSGTA